MVKTMSLKGLFLCRFRGLDYQRKAKKRTFV